MLLAAVHLGDRVTGVNVVSSCGHASDVLQQQTSKANLRLLHLLQVDAESDLTKKITHFINNYVVRLHSIFPLLHVLNFGQHMILGSNTKK